MNLANSEQLAAPETLGSPTPAPAGEHEFMVEEYKYLQQMQSLYMTHINQATNVFVALMAVLAAAAAVVWEISKGQLWDSLAFLVIAVAALAASYIVYERGFRSNIALCTFSQAEYRARRYFLDHYPGTNRYVSMPVSDEWPTPVPRRAGSAYWSFVLLNLLMASLVAAILLSFTASVAPKLSLPWLAAGPVIVFLVCAAVLIRRLNTKIEVYRTLHLGDIRFPLKDEEQSTS